MVSGKWKVENGKLKTEQLNNSNNINNITI